MKYRLVALHYIDDMLLEPGTEVGDGTGIPFRYPRDSNVVRPDGSRQIIKAGTARAPSVAMVPLDEEGKREYRNRFGDLPPDPDPVNRIPIMGNVRSTDLGQPKPPVHPPESSFKPDSRPENADGVTPAAPDNKGPGMTPLTERTDVAAPQGTPPSPAPSGPGSGKTEEEAQRETEVQSQAQRSTTPPKTPEEPKVIRPLEKK